jgi:hypothetical protein
MLRNSNSNYGGDLSVFVYVFERLLVSQNQKANAIADRFKTKIKN